MRVISLPRRAFASALVLAVTFGGVAFAPAALASGPTSLGVSGWQVYSNTNLYWNPDSAQIHGDPGEYAAAPAIPAQNSAGWVDCGPSATWRYSYYGSGSMCPSASTINMHVGSILGGLLEPTELHVFPGTGQYPCGHDYLNVQRGHERR